MARRLALINVDLSSGNEHIANFSRVGLVKFRLERPIEGSLLVLESIALRAMEEQKASAKATIASWRQFCACSVEQGGRIAHAFSRGPRLPPSLIVAKQEEMDPLDIGIEELPVQGARALEELLAFWKPLWSHLDRFGEDAALWDVRSQTLPPIELDRLNEVLKRTKEHAGLGKEKLHPRAVSLLSDDFKLRLIDLMHAYERNPGEILGVFDGHRFSQ